MDINRTYVIIACISFNIGTLSYAFITNSMNNALQTLYIVFDISKEHRYLVAGTLTSSAYFGALIGAIITTKIRRHHTGIIFADICMFIGSSMLIFNSIVIFILGRIIAGIGCGMTAVCSPIFVRQFSPTKMYSQMGGILSTTFSFGYFLTMIIGVWFPTTEDDVKNDDINQYFWRIYFFIGGIPSLIRIIIMCTIYNYQSPIYYIQNNQDNMALCILKKIYKTDDFLNLLQNLKEQNSTQINSVGFIIQKYKTQFIFGLFLMFIFQFCGFNAVVQYSTTIFKQSTSSQQTAQILSFLMSILKWILYTFAGTITLKYFGRRKPILFGLLFMCIANLGIFIFSITNNDYAIITFIFLFVLANFSSTGPIVPVYLPEFVPQQLIPYCYYTFWGYSIIILLLFPLAYEQFGKANCFIFFAIITFIGLLIFYKYAVETMNKTNQEIQRLFRYKLQGVLVEDQ